MRIILALLLMASTAGAQVELMPDKEWYRPDTTKEGRVYRDLDYSLKVVTGDTLSDKVKPHFTLERWGELSSSAWMQIQQFNTDPDSFWVRGDSFYVKDGFTIHRTYMKSETEFEWEIVLSEKPKSNVFSYDIETENLNFYYQDETTAVPGEYAVYHSSKGGLVKKSESAYGIGKALKMPCPKAWDANGDTVLVDQNVNTVTNKMIYTPDMQWLEDATYPVTIGPTFGADSIGGTLAAFSANTRICVKYQASGDGTADSIAFYFRLRANCGAFAAIYSDSSGAGDFPESPLDTTESTGSAGLGWFFGVLVDADATITNGVDYWLGWGASGGSCVSNMDCYYDTATQRSSVDATSIWLDPWESDFTYTNRRWSIYCFYTEAGAPAASPRRRKIISGGK